MKRRLSQIISSIILSLFIFLSLVSTALAAYLAYITMQNSSTTNYDMVGGSISANVSWMATNIFSNSEGLDTRVNQGTTAQKHMLANDRIAFATPLGASASRTLQFTTGNSLLSSFAIIPGYNGTVTILDSPTTEPSDNFSITWNGYLDTDNGTEKFLWSKGLDAQCFVSPTVAENVTATVGVQGLDFIRTNSDWVSIPDSAALDFTDGAGNDEPCTLITWINLDDATSSTLLAKWTAAGGQETWRFYTDGSDYLYFQCYDSGGATYIGRRTGAVTAYQGQWVQFAATYDGSETSAGINIYINGIDADTTTVQNLAYTGMSNTTSVLELGSYNTGGGGFLDGKMAETKIYTDELTPAEILANYNGEYRTADLEAWYEFTEGTGNPLDSTVNNHDATANTADWIDYSSVTLSGITSSKRSVLVETDGTFAGLGIDFTNSKGGLPLDTNLVINAPMWHSDLSTSPFITKDVNEATATVTGTVWGATGRTFDGATDFISIPSPFGDVNFKNTAFSIETWINTTSIATYNQILGIKPTTAGNYGIMVVKSSGTIYINWRRADGGAAGLVGFYANTPITASTWYHLLITYDGNGVPSDATVKIYFNGVAQAKTAGTTVSPWKATNNTIYIGRYATADPAWNGVIGETRVYDNDLTPADALYNYNATLWKYNGSSEHFFYELGATVANNGNDWLLFQNNIAPYSDNFSISKGGTEVVRYAPSNMIIGTTLPNELNPGTNDGIITWGAFPASITATLGILQSDYEMYQVSDTPQQDIMPAIPGKSNPTDAARDTALSTHIFYDVAKAIETITGGRFTAVFQFQMGLFTIALVLFCIGYFLFGNHLLIGGILSCIPMGYGVTIHAYDWWIIPALVLWLIGCAIAEGRQVVS